MDCRQAQIQVGLARLFSGHAQEEAEYLDTPAGGGEAGRKAQRTSECCGWVRGGLEFGVIDAKSLYLGTDNNKVLLSSMRTVLKIL